MLTPARLRTEYQVNPLGIDTTSPRFSWIVEAAGRGQHQRAYQILVASSQEAIEAGDGDMWDSGVVTSGATQHIRYEGAPLRPKTQYWWRVRVWDKDEQPSPYSESASWSMGPMSAEAWSAAWIGYDAPPDDAAAEVPESFDLEGCQWMVLSEDEASQPSERKAWVFRHTVEILPEPSIKYARFLISSGDQFELYVNGARAGASDGRHGACNRPSMIDVRPFLREGANTFAIWARHRRGRAGVIGRLRFDYEEAAPVIMPIDESWRATATPPDNWAAPDAGDSAWARPAPAALANEGPWGKLRPPLDIPPCPILRTSFQVERPIARAVVYATALGLYELRLNGSKVGEDVLTPGWTDFNKRVYYQAYDVSGDVFPGANTLAVVLGHGWYSGYVGPNERRGEYGLNPRARVQLELVYEDGNRETIVTDEGWRAAHGPIIGGDLLMGEAYDARRELHGWDRPSYDDTAWDFAAVDREVSVNVQAYPGAQTRKTVELTPVAITEPEPGVYVFDMGQNMVGCARLTVRGQAGEKVTLRFGEMLEPDGRLYLENLRGARATDEYWLRGAKKETWAPRFTFHGFRYIEAVGLPEPPDTETIRGLVMHADAPFAGEFACSDPMINQLYNNILWGQRGNFLEVPTDCPQRDERLGWMGDALVFAATSCFNMDAAAFYTKWLQDVRDAESPDSGAFPDVAPRACVLTDGAPGWGDAGVFVPWICYQHYGDAVLLERMYPGMKRWIEYMREADPDGVRRNRLNEAYGDWLSIGESAPIEALATAFYYASTERVAETARVLGYEEDAAEYRSLAETIKNAFNDAFVANDGRIEGDTQTGYALALHFSLLPEELRPKAAEHLVDNIKRRDWHLATGFLGTAYLLPVLTEAGCLDAAYRLLKNETFPSWGYTIRNGATTIWERWDGWTEENGFQDPGMNSFNHYAFGAVGEWLYQYVAGIGCDSAFPGFKRIIIKPCPGGGLEWARGVYDSIQGPIESAWEHREGQFSLRVRIPPNTRAMIHVPTDDAHNVREGDDPAMDAEGLTYKGSREGYAVYAARSGEYAFLSDKK